MDMKSRIIGCMAVEMAAAEIYRQMVSLFPEHRDFWESMIAEEENHTKLFIAGDMFKVFGEKSGQVPLPPSSLIEKTVKFAESLLAQIKGGPITLEKALRMILMLEESIVESYLYELKTDDEDSVAEEFRKVLVDEKSHVDKIRDFMIREGFLKVS